MKSLCYSAKGSDDANDVSVSLTPVGRCGRRPIAFVISEAAQMAGRLMTSLVATWCFSAVSGLASLRPCPSMTLEFSFALLPSGAGRARRRTRVCRDVVELLTETNAEDWPVVGPRTLAWCARFLDQRAGGSLDWRQSWSSMLKLGMQDWIRET